MAFLALSIDWLPILGLLSALLIGFSLGLIGGGGSILTVPVLVYLLHIPPGQAVSDSLFIVGITSLVGSARLMTQRLVSYRAALAFFIPSTVVVFLIRHFVAPALPTNLFTFNHFRLTKDDFTLGLFAVLMLFSAVSMIRQRTVVETAAAPRSFGYIFAEGVLVGLLTGLVGAGGGFLIVPALVLFARLPMKMAVGTSLLIIAANSLMGFAGDLTRGAPVAWSFLILFSTFAILGILLGIYLSTFISGPRLKPLFGWFVLFMGLYMLFREFL